MGSEIKDETSLGSLDFVGQWQCCLWPADPHAASRIQLGACADTAGRNGHRCQSPVLPCPLRLQVRRCRFAHLRGRERSGIPARGCRDCEDSAPSAIHGDSRDTGSRSGYGGRRRRERQRIPSTARQIRCRFWRSRGSGGTPHRLRHQLRPFHDLPRPVSAAGNRNKTATHMAWP